MKITRGKIETAYKIAVYGPEGIGKSTFASMFPDPVFIDTEGSTEHMDVARLPKPTSWQMVLDDIQYVKDHPDCCKTLVLDTADWAELLCIKQVCSSRGVTGIEDFGYGKGYTYLKEEFGKMLNLLTDVKDKGVNVVITAHAMMRKFEQPDELGAYDRWELKLSKQCAPLVKEWSDMLLFFNYKTMVVNVDNQGAQKGKNKAQGGRRVMYTSHHPCWDAKNRFNLPEECDMSYEVIRPIIDSNSNISDWSGGKETQPVMQKNIPQKEETLATDTKEPLAKPEETHQMDMIDLMHEKETIDTDPAEAMPEKIDAPEASPGSQVSKYLSDPARIPKALRDLMEQNNVSEWNIQDAVFSKGYYPENTLIQDMDPTFVEGCLIGAWDQVYEIIKTIRENNAVPFN